MNGNKNQSYGCGSIIAILIIFAFFVDVLPMAAAIIVIAIIGFGAYKNISNQKKIEESKESKNEQSIQRNEESILNENQLKDEIYKKNKLISEQNFDISEKNRIIDELKKKISEQKRQYDKVLSERNELIIKQKIHSSGEENIIKELQNTIDELKREINSNKEKEYLKMDDLDPYTWEAALFVTDKERCSISLIQRRFMIGFERASKIIEELYSIGIIGEEMEDGFISISADKYGMPEIYSKLLGGNLQKRKKCKVNSAAISELKNTISVKNSRIHELEEMVRSLKEEIGTIDEEHSEKKLKLEREFQEKYSESQKKINDIESEIEDIHTELEILNNEAIERYYQFSDYSNVTSQDCMNQLSVLKTKENELRKSGKDVIVFDYSSTKKIVERSIRQILRNFNSDCDNIITNIKVKNIDSVRDKIRKSYETLNNLYSKDDISLSKDILSLKLEQATLLYTYELKRIEEKEIQQAIKEQMIEEAKAEREIEQQKKKVEKDLQQHLGEVNRLMKYMQKTQIDAERQLYIEKIKELEDKIKNLEADKEAVLEREANAKAGFVYIISNIGSFGENIYKIGMTRRLEPMDRVKELSSASVPFEFDVHAMIFSSDAPELENMLHKHFADNAVNKVNPRKEFYKVDIDDIERVVKENYNDTVKFTKIPVAAEYRQSINLGMSVD